jgi:hypothetical protein
MCTNAYEFRMSEYTGVSAWVWTSPSHVLFGYVDTIIISGSHIHVADVHVMWIRKFEMYTDADLEDTVYSGTDI